jgi:hypothetical protein
MTFVTQLLRRSLLASGLLIGAGSLSAAWAQPSTGGPSTPAATPVPIDGGVSVLLVAGAGLALRRLRKSRGAHD